MRKVLFVATVTVHINSFHIPYLKMFKEKGYEVHVASFGTEEIKYCDKHFDLSFTREPFSLKNYKAYRELKKIIEENNYEIIHCHTPVGGVITRIAAKANRRKGTKVFYTAHGFHFYKGAPKLNWIIFYPIEKYLSKYTDCLITINEEDYELAKKKFKAKEIKLIHGVGVDENKFNFEMAEEDKKQLRESLGLKEDDFVLLQVGELNKNKNQIMSINAMKELIKEHSNIHLLLVGIGQLEDFYKQKVEEYNLNKNIHMLGYRKDVPNLTKISDLLISLSYREGLPVNVIEGMVSGLPAVVTNCRGNRDLVNNEENGYVLGNFEKEELALRIKEIYLNKEKKMYFSENAKKTTNKYLLESVLEEMSEIYEM